MSCAGTKMHGLDDIRAFTPARTYRNALAPIQNFPTTGYANIANGPRQMNKAAVA